MATWIAFIRKNKFFIAIGIIFLAFLFFRFYQIPERNPFSWDQIDNAWAAKNILYNHHYPLLGMVAKQNSGFYIGPLYYYAIAPAYFFTNYDPIASGIFAGLSAIVSFWGIYYVFIRKFGKSVTLIALLIQTFSTEAIHFDRVQWPVDFIPLLGLLAFYFLHEIISGKTKHILSLAIVIGLFWQVHFTAIFVPIITALCLPLFPRTKEVFKYGILGLLILLIAIAPNIISELSSKHSQANSLMTYAAQYSHGFHLKRMLQIIGDVFTQLDNFLPREIRNINIKYLFFPIFVIYALLQRQNVRSWRSMVYVMTCFFVVPWVIFTIYSGESSDYYYAINRFLCLALLAYPFALLWNQKQIVLKILPVLIIGYYLYSNVYTFFKWPEHSSLPQMRQEVQQAVQENHYINYTVGDPKSYLFFYYKYLQGQKAYDK